MRTWKAIGLFSVLVPVVQVASAHHPFSVTYDAVKSGMLAGKVVKVQWTDPHVVIAVDVELTGGKTELWLIEGYAPGKLRQEGWQNDQLIEGTRITVSGWYARDSALKVFHGRQLIFENGSKRVFGATPEEEDHWVCRSGPSTCPVWIPSIR